MGAKAISRVSQVITGQSLFVGLSVVLAVGAACAESIVLNALSLTQVCVPMLVSMAIVAGVGIWAVPFLLALKTGQFIREEGPKSHMAKAGTPTMGGLFVIPVAVCIALTLSLLSSSVLAVSCLTLAYGFIGWIDDWQVIRRQSNKGISPRMKLLLQILVSVVFCGWLFAFGPTDITSIRFPFGLALPLGILFWPLAGFTPVAQSNATNLTDGLDGLASGTSAIAFLGLAILTLPDQPGLAIFCACMAGGCLGFLAHNYNPARVFMGDTGSLALGGSMAAVALLSNHLFSLLILSGVFLIETLSVMAQVSYYKATKDEKGVGKRLFKMAPFHHHLELSGWSEIDVVAFFYGVGLLLAIATLVLAWV
ncbi:MAG: phospho-N-acetylmuramoyl-pentapeptide-transferase [Leptolyngbyaceae bacterium]|nr:phospho-N-acetylmuramoyl-pentapeptide-transferase [Leptolyngbyaceae bacterium]